MKIKFNMKELLALRLPEKRQQYVEGIINKAIVDVDLTESEEMMLTAMASEYVRSFSANTSVKILANLLRALNKINSSKSKGKPKSSDERTMVL